MRIHNLNIAANAIVFADDGFGDGRVGADSRAPPDHYFFLNQCRTMNLYTLTLIYISLGLNVARII